MEQFRQFSIEKQVVIDSLSQLRGILESLCETGIDTGDDIQKIESAITSVRSDVLRIALLGAFSDGKTSVIASWLGKIMEDMNISMDESSDRISVYKPEGLPGKCEIVDTPGLFGDKERDVGGKQVMYEDLTKRYISEAHLIFYVVDATNPLKDSHRDIVKWVLRDLNKLSSTIFVINKMDEVVNLSNQMLFDEQAAIKKDNLKGKLQRIAELNEKECNCLNIVCIASNPNGRGLPFWFERPEIYESRSRIYELRNITVEILKNNVASVLSAKTGMDVVKDIVTQRVNQLQLHLCEMDTLIHKNENDLRRFQDDIMQSRTEVRRLYGELSAELRQEEKQLLGLVRSLSPEDIRPFLNDELGYNEQEKSIGFRLSSRINLIVERYFQQSLQVTSRLSDSIRHQLNSSESFVSEMGESALRSLGDVAKNVSDMGTETIRTTIFRIRDRIKDITGCQIKFKPWGVTNLAGNISKWAGPTVIIATFASDAWEAWNVHKREKELEHARNELRDIINDVFNEFYKRMGTDESIFAEFSPQTELMEKAVTELAEKNQIICENQQKLGHVLSQLKQITFT
ncbi:GTP-binding protein [Escherichia coli]|nr:GTP-binding protein [Escherichia coli]EFA4517941.1 GTP-binding protein [Escherichia coli]EFD4922267.1 GTP-binding protein [Escherichia coli]EFN9646591.1 GTP-binding protein [Escherichia coli]EFN9723009.1 GTP-binding protein [Escherichia coli]